LQPPFTKSEDDLKNLISQNKLDGLNAIPIDHNFITLYFSPTSTSAFKVKADSDDKLRIRIVNSLQALHDASASDGQNYHAFSGYEAKEETANVHVQFYCYDNNSHIVTFKYSIVANLQDPLENPDMKTFRMVKTCKVGMKEDLALVFTEGYNKDPKSFQISKLPAIHDDKKDWIVLENATITFEITAETEYPNVIVSPKLERTDIRAPIEAQLLGKTKYGALLGKSHSVEFSLAFECKNDSSTGKQSAQNITVVFSFHIPPYDDVEIPFLLDCSKVKNLVRDLQLIVETQIGSKNVINLGQAQGYFHVKSDEKDTHLYLATADIGATEFFIYLDPNAEIKKLTEIKFDSISFTHDPAVINPEIVDLPSTDVFINETTKRMVLEYNCQKNGLVRLTVTFMGMGHKYDFSLMKHCLVYTYNPYSTTNIFQYILMIGAIAVGIYLIRLFKNLLLRERNKQSTSRTINVFNFRGTEMRTQPITILDDSLETDTRIDF